MSYNPYPPGPGPGPGQSPYPPPQYPYPTPPASGSAPVSGSSAYNRYPPASTYNQNDGAYGSGSGPSYPPPSHDVGRRDDRGSSGPSYRGGGGGGREMSPGRRYDPRGSAEPNNSRDRRRDRERDRKDGRSNEERISLERQCRTLFVRNISFDADPEKLKVDFTSHGEIKSWFDMIARRGMVFVTYYDLRPAQRAKDALHGITIGSRKIDVHYGLPKESELEAKCDREKNQGSLLMILKPRVTIDMQEVGRMCDSFGEVKSLKGCKSPDQAIVEFWDSRGATTMFDQMDKQPFCGGTLDIKFIWDAPPPSHGGSGPGPSRDRDSRDSRDSGPRRGSGPPHNGYPDRDPYPLGPPPGRYADAPPGPPQGDDRLDQAKKVQQLLASLGGVAPPQPPAPVAAPPSYRPAPSYQQPPAQPQGSGSGYAPRPPLPPQGQGGYRPPPPPDPRGPPPPVSYNSASNGYVSSNGPSYGAPPPAPSGGGFNPGPPPAQTGGYNSGPPPLSQSGGYNPGPPPTQAGGYSSGPPPPSGYGGGYPHSSPPPPRPPAPGGYQPNSSSYPPAPYIPGGPPPGPGYQAPPPPMAADPRRQAGAPAYRPPPPGPPAGQSEVGSLLAMLNQGR